MAWPEISSKLPPEAFAEAWGNDNYMVTKPVTLKAMVRVCADLSAQDAEPGGRPGGTLAATSITLGGAGMRDFRNEGFL